MPVSIENMEKFKKALALLNEIAVEYPSKKWEGECLFEDFQDSLSQDQKDEISEFHGKTHWKPFDIFF